MNNFPLMEIPEPRYELPSNLFHPINNIWSPLLLEVHIHVLTLHKLHYYVKFPGLVWPIVLFHEVFVLNYLGVDKILGYAIFTIHFF